MDAALKEIPSSKVPDTPVFLMATAGVRFLPQLQQTSLLQGICNYIQTNTQFDLPECGKRVQVISGETEGLYGWIATNYLLGGFDKPEHHNHGKSHHTYGFLDMGGASAQIAFAPNSTEAERHANDLKLVRMRRLDGSPTEYKVFTATWLGFGANKARSRYEDSLRAKYGDTEYEVPDPCLPVGLRVPVASAAATEDIRQTFVGTGGFEECLRNTYPLLEKEKECTDHPCLLNGQHVPAIDFDVNHFIGVSEYWHTTHGVFGKEHGAYDLASYQRTVTEFCSRDWASINSDISKRKKTTEAKIQDAKEACFKASWLINILYEGIGIPRLGVEPFPGTGANVTKGVKDTGEDASITESFRPVDKIEGVEVSWTLGKAVLYAAGQIQSASDSKSLPVGFGSNTLSTVPADFEHAGSVPLAVDSYTGYGDGNDDDDSSVGNRHPFLAGLLLLSVLLLALYTFRKPDRRRRVLGFFKWRRRPSGGRKPRRPFAFADNFWGRRNANYERVLEEGDAPEFELDMDIDDHDYSDSSDQSKGSKYAQSGISKGNFERQDDAPQASIMDRHGLVIRTESRERLVPNLQMLNAGKRSRAGSPTRLKSPFMIPLQEG